MEHMKQTSYLEQISAKSLNLVIEGLRLEKSITGRVDPKVGSIYEIVNIERAEGSSNFDTPININCLRTN